VSMLRSIAARSAAALAAMLGGGAEMRQRSLEQSADPPAPAEAATPTAPWRLRRWDAADTHRLNEAHWQHAHGQPINADLASDLKTLRARCSYEAANNPIVEGVIFSHGVDLVGSQGPTLQVVSDSDQYNDALEQLYTDWAQMPDINGRLSMADLLNQSVKLWWTKGEHVWQKVTADVGDDEISLRLLSIDPDRLDTPPGMHGDPLVALGVRRTKQGRPTNYYIAQPEFFGPYTFFATKFDELPSDDVIHQYEELEPGQVRGFPWLASALQTVADLRDYDQQVLDAARNAAAQGVVWYAEHPDASYLEVNESTPFQRGMNQTGPPGWKPMMIDPSQPGAHYVEFRTERLRELGRARSMPLMKILLGSEDHSFASARMDNQNYGRSLQMLAGWTERSSLNPLVNALAREGSLIRRNGRYLLPPRPARVTLKWNWPKQPHVDPVKEANAQDTKLKNGTISLYEAIEDDGRDVDAVIAGRKRANQQLLAAGLPAVTTDVPPAPPAQPAADDSPDDATPPDRKKKGAPANV